MTFCSTAASEQDRAPWTGEWFLSIEDGRAHGTKPAPTKGHHASGICISNLRAACHLANQSATMLQRNSKRSSLKYICLASTLENLFILTLSGNKMLTTHTHTHTGKATKDSGTLRALSEPPCQFSYSFFYLPTLFFFYV